MSQNGARNAAANGMGHVEILNFYYPNTAVAPIDTLDAIRVHIGDAERVELSSEGSMVFERGGVAVNALPSGSITVTAHDGGLQIGNAWTSGSPTDPVFVSFPQPVKLANNGHRYLWGRLQITNKNGKVRVVEVLTLEEYVAGIAEMPAAWPLEALKAQAIAARTYAHEVTSHRRNSTEWAQEYDISGSTVDQNYIGYDAQDSAWDQKWLAAVQATAGVAIIDANGPVRAYYSASNGGYTETAAYVFNNDVAHTVAGPDPYDEGGHPWTEWTRTYSQQSISRWLNASTDTAVGTVTAINVYEGAGASARIDKSVVEIVGTNGTKRVTGKRLMLVINAGVFGEGGGLSTHLPGTFTTIGNGVSAGPPRPTGAAIPAAITPDPVAEVVDENEGFTPPPGWEPEAGTGVAPGAPASGGDDVSDEALAAEDDLEAATAESPSPASESFSPPPGWVPEPGTGVAPGAAPTPAADNPSAPAATAASTAAGFTPPPGWEPEPGSGIAPETPAAAATAATDGSVAPPPGWTPEPGTGVAPRATATRTATAAADTTEDVLASTETAAVPTTAATPPATTTMSATSTLAEAATAAPATTTTNDTATPAASEPVTTAAAAASEFAPPEGWTPEPGTGVAPGGDTTTVGGTGGGDAQASGVFLVTRSGSEADSADADFAVIAPTADLAAESRQRVEELKTKAALGLSADFDIAGYVASVAPRLAQGACSPTASRVVCVPASVN